MKSFLPPSPRGLRRRSLLGCATLAWPMFASTRSFARRGSWKLAQSIALSGPLGDLGQEMHLGAKACFAQRNQKGGVFDRPIELVAVDDGYDVARAVNNVNLFLAQPDLFALFCCMGTPMIAAVLPAVIEKGVPFFAPFSGGLAARPRDARNVFPIRSSYPDEARRLIQHLSVIGVKRIGIAYQNNAFGKEIYDGARQAAAQFGLARPSATTVETDASNAAVAAQEIIGSEPEAVLVGMAGKPTLEFVRAIRARRRGLPLYALSVLGAASTLDALGSDAVGMIVSQVVPSPANTTVAVVRDFRAAWEGLGPKLEPTHLALEGYINARVFIESLMRAGGNATRGSFIASTWGMRHVDLGGFDVGFTEPGQGASRYIELTMVGARKKFLR